MDSSNKDSPQHNAIESQLKNIYPVQTNEFKSETVKGYDFNNGIDFSKLIEAFSTTGLQSSNFSKSIDEINSMIKWRLSSEPITETDSDEYLNPEFRSKVRCTIFLGYTSNMVSSGLRETIRYLVEHKMVDCLVTTAGGIEEDFIKCFKPFYLGEFTPDDTELRKKGLNRIGNMYVPSENYCVFEDWIIPIFKEMYEEQINNKTIWSPSKMIKRLGEKIDNKESIYYWAAKNNIPVFCPALTDGAIGDMLFFNSYKYEDFILDIISDVKEINKLALKAKKSGVIILGGGVVKHHIMNANIWRNGADFAVFINTGVMYDGSDSGATPSEAISWGKMKSQGEHVKIFCEASLVFPLIVSQTFAKFKEIASRL